MPNQKNSLLKSSLIVSILTLCSRILGLIRDVVLMNVFGASGLMDAFLVAFKIPNFLRRLFSEGAFAQGFMPVLADYQHKSQHELQIFISRTFGTLSLLLTLLTTLAVMFAPLLIGLFAVGFVGDSVKFDTTISLFKITFPYVLLITLTAFASSILQSFERFILPAIVPMLLNICLIIFAVFLNQYFAKQIFSLAVAVCVAGFLQLCSVLIPLYQQKLLILPKVDFAHQGVKRLLTLLIPAILCVSVLQINLLINTFFASFLPTGSVSWLYTAERLSEFPLGIIGVAIGTVILPTLSKNLQTDNIKQTLDWACYLVLLVGIPACVALWQIAEILMIALFVRGEFGVHDALMSAKALQAMSVGILALMLIKIFSPVFFVNGQAKFTLKAGLWAMVANIASVMILLSIFTKYHLALHTALAWAISIASWVNIVILWISLARQRFFTFDKIWQKRWLQIIFANVSMIICLDFLIGFFPTHQNQSGRIFALFGICLVAGLVYLLVLWVMGFRLKQLKNPI